MYTKVGLPNGNYSEASFSFFQYVHNVNSNSEDGVAVTKQTCEKLFSCKPIAYL